MTPQIKQRIEQIKRGEVPQEYKKTKIGIVPEEWEEYLFGDLFDPFDLRTEDTEKYPLYSLTIEEGVVPKTDRYERGHLVKKENSYKIVRPNDFAYNPMNVRFGAVARYKGKTDVSASGYYDIFTTRYKSDLRFMDFFLVSDKMISYYNKVSIGSLVEKQRVHFSQFMNFVLPLPNIEEREKIAEILACQDKIIELNRRKVEELKKLKKAYLSRMFPKKGSDVPELRFNGFTAPWEQRKFSEVFSFLQNNTLSRADLSEESGAAKNVHYGDVLIKFGEYLDVRKEHLAFIPTEAVAHKYKSSFLQNGDVIIADTAEDETVGKCCEIANSEGNTLVSGLHTIPCRPNQKYASGFLGYYMNSPAYHDQLLPLMQGTKVTSVSKTAISDTQLMYPISIDEQRRISQYFLSIDNLITLHQRKVEELQNEKKALMQLLLTGIVRA